MGKSKREKKATQTAKKHTGKTQFITLHQVWDRALFTQHFTFTSYMMKLFSTLFMEEQSEVERVYSLG